MKYFVVTAKCGHVGRDRYYQGMFPVWAENASEAAAVARNRPRVKHDHKDAILSVVEVCQEEYLAKLEAMESEPYFNCHSKYEQRQMWNEIVENVYEETELALRRKGKFGKREANGRKKKRPYKLERARLRAEDIRYMWSEVC